STHGDCTRDRMGRTRRTVTGGLVGIMATGLNLPARYARGAMLGRSREVASSQLTEEPGLRGLPVSHNGLRRDVQDLRRFLDGQAPKEPQLDDLTHPRIERRHSAERIADGDEVALLRVRHLLRVIQTHMNRTATTFLAMPAAGGLHEDPTHHLCRQSKE